jgi:hypothetical protein
VHFCNCVYCCDLQCNCIMCVDHVTLDYNSNRTAVWRAGTGRSCNRPPRRRFFLVFLCPWANAEMVPKMPSCQYMLLM